MTPFEIVAIFCMIVTPKYLVAFCAALYAQLSI